MRRAKARALNLTDRVKAVQEAFDLTVNPSLALDTVTTRVRDAFAAANTVLAQGNTTSQARRTALQNPITALRDQANAEFAANQSVDRTSAAFRNQLPTLTRPAGKSREGRVLINELAVGRLRVAGRGHGGGEGYGLAVRVPGRRERRRRLLRQRRRAAF